MQKAPFVLPIVGGRKIEQLEANVEALRITLSDEHIQYLESILPFEPGFPVRLMVRTILGNSSDFSKNYLRRIPGRRVELSIRHAGGRVC